MFILSTTKLIWKYKHITWNFLPFFHNPRRYFTCSNASLENWQTLTKQGIFFFSFLYTMKFSSYALSLYILFLSHFFSFSFLMWIIWTSTLKAATQVVFHATIFPSAWKRSRSLFTHQLRTSIYQQTRKRLDSIYIYIYLHFILCDILIITFKSKST